jgi:Flp pilus assembly protein TadD
MLAGSVACANCIVMVSDDQHVGHHHGRLWHTGKSVKQLEATLNMEPRYWVAHICAAKSYEQQDQYTEALAACAKACKFSGGNTEALSLAGYVHAVRGERAEAEGKIQQMLQLKTKRFVPPYNLALVLQIVARVGFSRFRKASSSQRQF